MDPAIIICDSWGKPTNEYVKKEAGHTGVGKHHLAITVLLINNKGRVLLQKRKHKRFDKLWDLTGATDLYHLENNKDESFEQAALRCLKREYQVSKVNNLRNLGGFNYFAKWGEYCENEYCVMMVGEYDGEIKMDPSVGYEFKWMDKDDFLKDIKSNPKNYTPWAIKGASLAEDLMLAVLKEKAAPGVTIKKIPIPKLKKDEVLVKVIYASICGTDIGIYDWIPWAASHIKPPIVIGHEVVGEVVEVNSNQKTNLKIGDLVSSETHIFCLNCFQCKIKNYHVCENMQLFGIGRDGAFAEYATIPLRTTWKNDPAIPLEAMSVQEPLGNAVNAVTKAEVKGKKVLIMGLGPTGLCAGAVAKAYGAKEIVGVNDEPFRRKLADKSGWFTKTIAKVSKKEYGTYDVILEMSGNRLGIEIAFDAIRIAGKIVAFGIPKENITIDWGKYMINKELTIVSVFGRQIWDTWKETTRLLKSGQIDLKKTITHQFALKDFEKAMQVMKSRKCGKILLKP